MNYDITIKSIAIKKGDMTICVKGVICDNQISAGLFSKPKLILYFNNKQEDRRIPFVISDLRYYGDRCVFTGEYTYSLNMLFWKTRSKFLPFSLTFNLSYANCYFENVTIQQPPLEVDCDNYWYAFSWQNNGAQFNPCKKNISENRINGGRAFLRSVISGVFYFVMYLLGICLLPLFFIEALLALVGCAEFACAYDGRAVGTVIGHMNSRLESFSKRKLTIRKINRALIILLYKLFSLKRIKPNRISFISARRNELSGNFEFVYNRLKGDRNLDIQFIMNDKTLRQLSLSDIIKFCNACATSKVIVLDEYTPQIHFIDLKPRTRLIQLWHACGAFKTFGFTRLGKPKGSPQATRNHRSYDYVTVSSKYCCRCHSEGFGIPTANVVPTGIPRTDVFFDKSYAEKTIAAFYEKYPQLREKKIILFAPTFRGDVKETAYYPVEMFDLERVLSEIGDDYAVIVKHHPFVLQQQPIPEQYADRVFDMSADTEINDLLFVSDLIITDYSSLVFEASLLKIPMLFYAFDLEDYINNRDFYFDLQLCSPGKLVYTLNELISAIKEEDFEAEKIEPFARTFFDDFDGKSTQRVANLIYECMKQKGRS